MSATNKVQEDYNRPFAKNLRKLLDNEEDKSPLKRKVTQSELADEICKKGHPVKRQTISLYKDGRATPDIEKFKIIADFFNVSYDFLLGESSVTKREYYGIAEKTGLSEKAIKTLIDLYYREKGNSFTMTVNTLLENESVLYAIAEYLYYDLECETCDVMPYNAVFRHKQGNGFYHRTDPEGNTVYPVDGDSDIQVLDNVVFRRLKMLETQERLIELLTSVLKKEQQDKDL